jgi:hypothetical protein
MQSKGDLLVCRDEGRQLLRGFSFSRSQMEKDAFRLRAFAQLLTIPEDTLTFALSRELGEFWIDGDVERAFTEAARIANEQGKPYLALVADWDVLLTNLELVAGAFSDERRLHEIRCHCLILSGQRQARRVRKFRRPRIHG